MTRSSTEKTAETCGTLHLPPMSKKHIPLSNSPTPPTQKTARGWCISSWWSMCTSVCKASTRREKQREAKKTQQLSIVRTSMRAHPKVFLSFFSCWEPEVDNFDCLASLHAIIGLDVSSSSTTLLVSLATSLDSSFWSFSLWPY